MPDLQMRAMEPSEREEVAALICHSTNHWYTSKGKTAIFKNEQATLIFPDVYEALDPGCCRVAVDVDKKVIAGSCFYHPRETHVSLGIMNVHPDYFGKGIARDLLTFVADLASSEGKPLRLVSSAMNLDSYSLYNRAGMKPIAVYQDMMLKNPEKDIVSPYPELAGNLRDAVPGDVDAMVKLEYEIQGIKRGKDFEYFIENALGVWHGSVLENDSGYLSGFVFSVKHPGSCMLGPGVAQSSKVATALICRELNVIKNGNPVFLIPSADIALIQDMYVIGAKNVEIHLAQVLGDAQAPHGVVVPTFMPETG